MKKILYIEDSPVSMFVVRRMMRTMDYELIEAGDGATGILSAIHDAPDLILMDLILPDMSGFDAIRQIKSHPTLKHIPIVALTSDTSAETRAACLKMGCEGYLHKPVSRMQLLRTLNQFRMTTEMT